MCARCHERLELREPRGHRFGAGAVVRRRPRHGRPADHRDGRDAPRGADSRRKGQRPVRARARRRGRARWCSAPATRLRSLGRPPGLGIAARAIVGIGTGLAFVSGSALVRESGGSPLAQGVFGGISLAPAGVALAVVPQLEHVLGWRAPYWSAVGGRRSRAGDRGRDPRGRGALEAARNAGERAAAAWFRIAGSTDSPSSTRPRTASVSCSPTGSSSCSSATAT